MYRHIVLFQFKESARAAEVAALEQAFLALPAQIPAVKALEWGRNVSPEGLDGGLTHAFLVTFESKAVLEAEYLHHPAHEAFVAQLLPILEKAVVVDYVPA
jgi:hypothetical protein